MSCRTGKCERPEQKCECEGPEQKCERPEREAGPSLLSEATPLRWQQMHPSTLRALKQLIEWLTAAVRHTNARPSEGHSRNEQLSTSFLINGLRGFGKTTVLMTAAAALDSNSSIKQFFKCVKANEDDNERWRRKIEYLQPRLHWLDTLDLELLDRNANLLAFLLVRIRLYLDKKGGGKKRASSSGIPATILGGPVEKTWRTLDRLLSDASFMWEEVQGASRLERTEQQISAAETFSTFTEDFRRVIPKVIDAIGPDFPGDRSILVLSIDNVDRSIEHLSGIVKLIRMAYSDRLWFLLAAGRPDFQLFLARSFEHELGTSRGGCDQRELEDTRYIARRQAATTIIRMLPPSYQIKIGSVMPKSAWTYQDERLLGTDKLSELLSSFHLPKIREPRKADELKRYAFTLYDKPPQSGQTPTGIEPTASMLFEIGRRLTGEAKKSYLRAAKEAAEEEEEEKEEHRDPRSTQHARSEHPSRKNASDGWIWTYAGRMALTCAPRTLRDFAIALVDARRRALESAPPAPAERASGGEPAGTSPHAKTEPTKKKEDEDEEENDHRTYLRQSDALARVLVRVLRFAIDESDIPYWASEMMSQLIRKDTKDRSVLDLRDSPIYPVGHTGLYRKVDCSRRETDEGCRSGRIDEDGQITQEWSTEIHLYQVGDLNFELRERVPPCRSHPLPLEIAGWLMLTHDLLAMFPYDRVRRTTQVAHDLSARVVATTHLLPFDRELVDLTFWWRRPQWATFLDFDIFSAQWRAFIQAAEKPMNSPINEGPSARLLARLFTAAWVDNVCSVANDDTRGRWEWPTDLKALFDVPDENFQQKLGIYEDHVRDNIGLLWYGTSNVSSAASGRPRMAREWLKETLPLLVLPELSPHPSATAILHHSIIQKDTAGAKGWHEMYNCWKMSVRHLQARRRQMVREVAMDSQAFQSKKGKDGLSQKELERWLDRLVTAWFNKVDTSVDVEARIPKFLQEVTDSERTS